MTCVILLLSLLSICLSAIALLLACRLIALNKNPGVHPFGIGDTARWIIAKAILTITRMGIQEAAGSLQLSGGQISGIEAAVQPLICYFNERRQRPFCWWTPAMRLAPLTISLPYITSINCVYHLLQPSSTPTGHQPNYLLRVMCYTPVKVYTTQGDPLAMSMYTLAIG